MSPTSNESKAFTLIEVICGLAVTVLVVGGIFGVAGSALDLATTSNRQRTEEMRHHHLDHFLRGCLLRLPPKARVAMSSAESLTWLDSKGTFQWPGSGSQGDRVDLRHTDQAIELVQFLGDTEIASLILIEKVSAASFEVYDSTRRTWTDRIPFHSPIRPKLLKMRYRMEGDLGDRVEVFWIPKFFPADFTPGSNPSVHESSP